MKRIIKIGTRESPLAMWQANTVASLLESLGQKVSIVPITSSGDIELTQPLYEMGITGIFTKNLDLALLEGRIDLAVHSMKDVPTKLPNGLMQMAVLERAAYEDVLITPPNKPFPKDTTVSMTIATGSLRRKAQWLHKYPNHHIVNLRGNVNTRLRKLSENPWQGAIFAKAGLQRIELLADKHQVLHWMLPAPAQGIVMVAGRKDDKELIELTAQINNREAAVAAHIERSFLQTLEGGCTAPIGALAKQQGDAIHFEGALFSLDGKQKITHTLKASLQDFQDLGIQAAKEIRDKGGVSLLKEIEAQLKKNE
ncbi:MAG: hydroxymethylbilane synthase [Flavobacteriaceae bacterium]|nr:hydroxymethylbilane synthase [Flavobacteriaceae bacterium]